MCAGLLIAAIIAILLLAAILARLIFRENPYHEEDAQVIEPAEDRRACS
ncbi:hypothetical protein [Afipia carboxidovorans]|nr:hypothetical protein CRBSH125_05650 [Afipia carboxidovorans]